MNCIKSWFFNPFRFESLEMRRAYFLFNQEVEDKLLGLTHSIITATFVFITIVGLFFNIELQSILIRLALVISSIILYFIRKRWVRLYKVGIIALGGCFMLYIMVFIADSYKDYRDNNIFFTGNAIGLFEVIAVLSFKSIGSRSFTYIALFLVKIGTLYKDFAQDSRVLLHFMVSVVEVFFFCVYHDILDRRNFAIIYKANEEIKKFQDLLSNDLPSSVMVMSSDFGSILYSNKFFQQNFAPDGDTAITTKIIKDLFGKLILQVEEKDIEMARFKHTTSLLDYLIAITIQNSEYQENEQVRALYASYKDEEECEIHYEVRLRRILWDGKHSYAVVMNDVTDKQLVTALKIADTQKDRVIATVSHELRTPINGIIGLLEMASELTTDKTQASYLENCKNCSKLLLYLVNAILDLSQLRNNSLKIIKNTFNINEMLEEVRSLYIFPSQQKGIQFIIEKDPFIDEEIYTDKYRLVEVLINLLGNAMKFTFNGSVKLKVFKSEKRKHALCFCIEDTGLGIKDKDKPKLFKMFGKIEQTNKNINTHGAGLGLTIVNELVKALNENKYKDERVMFESEFNKGSKFWFEIDVVKADESSFNVNLITEKNLSSKDFDSHDILELTDPSQTPCSKFETLKYQIQTPSEKHTFLGVLEGKEDFLTRQNNNEKALGNILLVDDNPLNLLAAEYLLKKLKFSVTKAFNGQEAIKILGDSVGNEKKYCLVLTDIQMPIMDGLEMSKKIKEKIEKHEIYGVPIVALTAKTLDEKEHQMYTECGITCSLEKPLIKSEIEKILFDLVNKNDL